jgi:hypothetical protein
MTLKYGQSIALLMLMTTVFVVGELNGIAQTDTDAGQKEKRAAEAQQANSTKGRAASSAPQFGTITDAKTREALQAQKQADEFLYMISSGAPRFNRTIQNKPYSAEAVTETIRILEDGNRIVRRNTMRQYRDRGGRTRRELILEALSPSIPVGPHEMILLYDPVKGVNYIVDAEHEVTRQFNLPAKAGSVQRDFLQSVPNRMSPELQTENLGSRTIEGLQCIGTKRTLHIPPGEIGNQAPIVAITETWYSAEIEGVVDSISSDPRYGTTHYKLQRVKRDEPSPELFVPPPQYKVELVNTQYN